MAARAFSFTIPKPLAAGSSGFTDQDVQINLFNDLFVKYSDADAGSQVGDIVQYNFGTSGFVEIKFDRGFSRQVQQRVLSTKFGDGYEQRIRDGINHKEESFAIRLANRRWEEIALISSYFDIITPGNFPIILERETIKVVCQNYSIQIGHTDLQSISTQLKRVYEA